MIGKYIKLLARRAPGLFGPLYKETIEAFQHKEGSNGRPILVLPGFTANDHSTIVLRASLAAAGFKPYTWDHGINLIASNKLIYSLLDRLETIYKENDNTPVTVIGWSMGGFYARALAYMKPEFVNSVITMGTPFKRDMDMEDLGKKYKKIGINIEDHHIDNEILENIKKTPCVPFTSIYSVVDFLAPVDESKEIETPISENVEVQTGHFGMGCDPQSLKVILNRCMEEKATWKKYQQ